jgi:hypothetical protein
MDRNASHQLVPGAGQREAIASVREAAAKRPRDLLPSYRRMASRACERSRRLSMRTT